jgi:hypothetical protein
MVPKTMTQLGPDQSTNQPVIRASRRPFTLPTLVATEVTSGVKSSSKAIALKRADKTKL